jgi:hypothetical protein
MKGLTLNRPSHRDRFSIRPAEHYNPYEFVVSACGSFPGGPTESITRVELNRGLRWSRECGAGSDAQKGKRGNGDGLFQIQQECAAQV